MQHRNTYKNLIFAMNLQEETQKANDVAKEIGISENSANKFYFLCQVSNVEILAYSRRRF